MLEYQFKSHLFFWSSSLSMHLGRQWKNTVHYVYTHTHTQIFRTNSSFHAPLMVHTAGREGVTAFAFAFVFQCEVPGVCWGILAHIYAFHVFSLYIYIIVVKKWEKRVSLYLSNTSAEIKWRYQHCDIEAAASTASIPFGHQFKSRLFYFCSSSLLKQLGKQQRQLKCLSPELTWLTWKRLLASTWPSLGCCGHLGKWTNRWKISVFLSLSASFLTTL